MTITVTHARIVRAIAITLSLPVGIACACAPFLAWGVDEAGESATVRFLVLGWLPLVLVAVPALIAGLWRGRAPKTRVMLCAPMIVTALWAAAAILSPAMVG